jgi:hypothetical protein
MLTQEEEFRLATRFREEDDLEAARNWCFRICVW